MKEFAWLNKDLWSHGDLDHFQAIHITPTPPSGQLSVFLPLRMNELAQQLYAATRSQYKEPLYMVQIANSPLDGQKAVCLPVGLPNVPVMLADNKLSPDSVFLTAQMLNWRLHWGKYSTLLTWDQMSLLSLTDFIIIFFLLWKIFFGIGVTSVFIAIGTIHLLSLVLIKKLWVIMSVSQKDGHLVGCW